MGKKPLYVIVAILVILVGVRLVLFSGGGGDDRQMIREALAESIEASKEGRAGGVMDKISNEIKVNNMDPGSTSRIANYIKNNKPDVDVLRPDPVVTGDTAQIQSPVRIKVSGFGGLNFDETVDNVTLIFRREDSRKWLIFPTKQWRLYEVQVPDNAFSNLASGFGS